MHRQLVKKTSMHNIIVIFFILENALKIDNIWVNINTRIRGRHDLEAPFKQNVKRVMMIVMVMMKCIHKASASCYCYARSMLSLELCFLLFFSSLFSVADKKEVYFCSRSSIGIEASEQVCE